MRNLGKMGESAFSAMCASAGLTANSSDVDKTGWDFFVEFNFDPPIKRDFSTVHISALECKIQIKSTDGLSRKNQVKLSNLKRLATTPSPAFFVFFEYDGKDIPQRAYLVHIDKSTISRVLNAAHTTEQIEGKENLHKKKMTISYTEENLLPDVTGRALADALRKCIGPSLAEYVKEKTLFLENVGFDESFGELEFSTIGIENLSKLIDISIGIKDQVDISELIGFEKRFGRKNAIPFVDQRNLKLEMPDLEPTAKGTLKIRTGKFSPAYSFAACLFVSPFHNSVPIDLRRVRIAGLFFDFVFNPFTNECIFKFEFEDVDYEIKSLLQNLKFLEKICIAKQSLHCEFISEPFPALKFVTSSPGFDFKFAQQILAIESSLRIFSRLQIHAPIEISLRAAQKYSSRIIEMEKVLNIETNIYRLQIPSDDILMPLHTEIAIIFFFSTAIGKFWLGTFITMIGTCLPPKDGFYEFFSTISTIDEILVQEPGETIRNSDLISLSESLANKYEKKYVVFKRFNDEELTFPSD